MLQTETAWSQIIGDTDTFFLITITDWMQILRHFKSQSIQDMLN